MSLILSNIGHKYITEKLKVSSTFEIQSNYETSFLLLVLREKIYKGASNNLINKLLTSGFLQNSYDLTIEEIDFRYKKNPLEHVTRLIFEFTTLCNFNCVHCRNGYTSKTSETNIEKLKSISDVFKLLNVKRFDFIGGEVTKFGNRWLDLAKYINHNCDNILTVYTNGWWLEKTNFEAAGKIYTNDIEYLNELKNSGITHILLSIDGREKAHDESRNCKGLYRRILNSFERIKQIGIKPRITALVINNQDAELMNSFAQIASLMYNFPENIGIEAKVFYMNSDETNHFSNFIDIGNGVNLKKGKYNVDEIPSYMLTCKAFYRPSPGLRIMANGNLSVCPLLDAGEGYGNIHESDIVEILNNFQNSFVYKLHANKELAKYLKYYDTSIFGESIDHICSLRVILTLIARNINLYNDTNKQTILKINKEIAKYSGHKVIDK